MSACFLLRHARRTKRMRVYLWSTSRGKLHAELRTGKCSTVPTSLVLGGQFSFRLHMGSVYGRFDTIRKFYYWTEIQAIFRTLFELRLIRC